DRFVGQPHLFAGGLDVQSAAAHDKGAGLAGVVGAGGVECADIRGGEAVVGTAQHDAGLRNGITEAIVHRGDRERVVRTYRSVKSENDRAAILPKRYGVDAGAARVRKEVAEWIRCWIVDGRV